MIINANKLRLRDEGDQSLTLARAVIANQITDAKEYFQEFHGSTRFSSDLLAISTRVSSPQMTELLVRNGFSMVSEDLPSVCTNLDRVRHILPGYKSPVLKLLKSHPVTVSNEERCAALEIALDTNAVRATDLTYVAILYDDVVVDLLRRRHELQLAEPYLTLLTGEQADQPVYQHELSEMQAIFEKLDDTELLRRMKLLSETAGYELLRLREPRLLSLERICSEKLFMFCASRTDLAERGYDKQQSIQALLDWQNAEGLEYALRNNWASYSQNLKEIHAAVLNSKKYSPQIRTVILEDIERRRVPNQSTVVLGLQIEDPAPVRENRPEWDAYLQSDGTYHIFGYNGCNAMVTIPDQIDGVPVTKVSAFAFADSAPDLPDQIRCNRRNVVCVEYPGTIEQIDGIRFLDDCGSRKLERVTLNEGSTRIDSFAFSDMNIAEVRLPSTMERIGAYAFNRTKSLRSINLPANLSFVGPHAFGYTAISKVVLPAGLKKLSTGLQRLRFSVRCSFLGRTA